MRIPRIYVPQPLSDGDIVHLPEQAGEHLARVLRLEAGHPLVLFNGDGGEFTARLASLAKRSVTAQVLEARAADRESPLQLTLAQGVARGEKMDWILQKATELGVSRIIPVVTERTEVRLDEERAERRLSHWHQVIASACEQCGRNRLPQVTPPIKLAAWAGQLGADPAARYALLPEGDQSLASITSLPHGAILTVGPEGGFSDQDEAILRNAGFKGLRLGPRILRTETAGIAALAALQAIAGDLGG
ncbi:16S rRNA (uracil(1498)-N(3))-methyltransferase [Tahibacter amnicola]|uniref:Ribosomal RNA small subunit methyltransferase E n=1 Tax=Tahibacter amnicola TaxID=2976241 RepID=A0ABY6BIP2_9GAMM|nr:16S rRNA (uracil(1498)-N(3))-methyltransferase [Tahibacter amnicola]UXI69367.1 16S rRNA (uracil(1498)-N(3))-methyltransferase [Tahibacter amnicola]